MSRKIRLLLAGGGLLVVVALALAVFTGIRFWSMNAEESARDSAAQAAREHTLTMFGRDPKDVSANINKTMGFLTGSAKQELQKNVTEHKIAETVKKDKIVTIAKVEGAGVMENTRDTAKVLVYLNLSTSRNTNTEEVQIDQSRIVYDMVKRDGEWLISTIDILTDDSLASRVQQSDGPAPSGAVPIPSGAPAPTQAPAPSTQRPPAP
ncbi:hypothetical protein [Gordonia sp. (in: high G+C Gram-positive bacteria)]|uniref:hypothetical protein n=1 Tax=Gordonia sp. (in: high G+C Gram-positive bacteria) TaxID=84139 RepID=UPI003F9E1ED9